MFDIIAKATETAPAAGTAPTAVTAGGGFSSILMIVVMFAIMYFLIIRPQKKKEKQTKEMIAALGVGDTITTIGGIVGKITKIKDDELLISTGMTGNPAERSTLRFSKWAVRDVVKKAENEKLDVAPTEVEEKEENTTEEN